MTKNQPIGRVECDRKNCTEMADVFRFRPRSDDEKRKRFAGKWYAVCPKKHRCDDQDYIAENGEIWGDEKPKESAPVEPVKTPAAPAKTVPMKPQKTPVKPASAPVPAPATEAEKSESWKLPETLLG